MLEALTAFRQRKYLHSLDLLRGLAACAVMVFHFTIKTTITLPDNNILRRLGAHGDYGVQVFFIISGLVIPYSLAISRYSLSDILNFLRKRILRIDIPYIGIIIFEIFLIYLASLTPWGGTGLERLNLENILLHIGYLNALFGKEWLLPIFWTLAIEFQFYLMIAILFPLINYNLITANASIVGLVLLSFLLPVPYLIFPYLLFFAIGIVLYFYKIEKISLYNFLLLLFSLLVVLFFEYEIILNVLIISTIGAILFLEKIGKIFSFLGKISFSIYLIHIPVGGRILAMVERSGLNEFHKSIIIIITIGLTILSSYIFYLLIEKPSIEFAKTRQFKSVFSFKEQTS